ncbi:uncharacterized protein LOC129319317 [Prosopis cineraria]|uniref:uncharacterized protein LOC129319317 n=1 Tax=Prosopis cineraria TaxID=364024 RepID=UPI0024100FE5|nr:uncharacterized protein LOC129319317 [Prosopis cineraria]XP_054820318.1 uncharacterized protein LOC129319317 [Prosopis cineraria]
MSSSNNSKGKKCIGDHLGYGSRYVSDDNGNKPSKGKKSCIGDHLGYGRTYASDNNGNKSSKGGKSCIGDHLGYGSTYVSGDNGNKPSKGSSKEPTIGDLMGYGEKPPPTDK